MQLYAIIGAAGTGALIIMEQDTLYLSFSEIPDASEILFKGEIPGIFVEEAIRSHSFPWSHAIFMKAWNYIFS